MARLIHLATDIYREITRAHRGPDDDWPEDEDGRPLTEAEIDEAINQREEDEAYWARED